MDRTVRATHEKDAHIMILGITAIAASCALGTALTAGCVHLVMTFIEREPQHG